MEMNSTKNGSVLIDKTSTKESKDDEMTVESLKEVESKKHVSDVKNGSNDVSTMYEHKGLSKELKSKATNGYFNGYSSE